MVFQKNEYFAKTLEQNVGDNIKVPRKNVAKVIFKKFKLRSNVRILQYIPRDFTNLVY